MKNKVLILIFVFFGLENLMAFGFSNPLELAYPLLNISNIEEKVVKEFVPLNTNSVVMVRDSRMKEISKTNPEGFFVDGFSGYCFYLPLEVKYSDRIVNYNHRYECHTLFPSLDLIRDILTPAYYDPKRPELKKNILLLKALALAKTRKELQPEIAKSYLAEALKIAPEDPEIPLIFGIIEIASGQYNSARPYLEKVLEMDPNNSDALFLKGVIAHYSRNSIDDDPKVYFTEAAKIDKNKEAVLAENSDKPLLSVLKY
jgi:tetratricopeptide (TPR) repeat protein